MTSGDFARASRLSPKALRLYDELGLLSPAEVDPASGYRRYAPAQLEQARLVAWLRRLGMPLARIRSVSSMPRIEAAADLAAYWRQVEAETSAWQDLAAFLIGYLSGRGMSMSETNEQLVIRYDIGLQREVNEDSAYASARLLAVADGVSCTSGTRAPTCCV
ncbi:MAG TPA: helix-turn-helix domain-containing protein, partial [Streptosporangiaceae bacterium]